MFLDGTPLGVSFLDSTRPRVDEAAGRAGDWTRPRVHEAAGRAGDWTRPRVHESEARASFH